MKLPGRSNRLPNGPEFLKLVRKQEDSAAKWTQQALKTAGKRAPQLMDSLGQMLLYMDLQGSCFWGCARGDHAVEYIIGGSSGTARAALRLTEMAFYDEALNLSRSIGERANLLMLFARDPDALKRWRALASEERRRAFTAMNVRLAIEATGAEPPINQERYGILSNYGVHPGRPPQVFDPAKRPAVAAVPNEIGVLACLNELSEAALYVMGIGAVLLPRELVPRDEILGIAATAADHIGGVNVLSLPRMLEEIRKAQAQ